MYANSSQHVKLSNCTEYQEQIQTWGISELALYACEEGAISDSRLYLEIAKKRVRKP
jgi:hypothetical protein